jgi:ribonuclease III
LGYRFAAIHWLETALTHRSAGSPHNERLEFLGDAVLGFVIAKALYDRYPEADEGQLSRLRALLVRKDALAQMARNLDLGAYLHLGVGELRSGGQSRESILADAFEAVLAAVFLDGGFAAARDLILGLFDARLQGLSLEMVQKDPKTRLQEYLQARHGNLPIYEIWQVSGDQHAQEFTVRCTLPDTGQASAGQGSSRRQAEQIAAQAMLETLFDVIDA